MNSKVYEKVKEFICENNVWIKGEEILVSSNLIDLGVDSVQMMMLLVWVENNFNIVMPDDVLEQDIFTTVESFVKYVEGMIDESNMD